MRSSLEGRIERLEQALGEAGCICSEHRMKCVEVQHGWTQEQMDAAAKTAWFTCPVHGYRKPETLVRLVCFSFEKIRRAARQ
jgi:hypothetical protein